jgi:hypothetical protein
MILPANNVRSVGKTFAFTLVEMAVVAAMLTILISSGIGLYRNNHGTARRISVDVIRGLIELAKNHAIAKQAEVLLVFEEPDASQAGNNCCRVVLMQQRTQLLADGESPIAHYDLLSHWQELPSDVVFIGGEIDGGPNLFDSPPTEVIWMRGARETTAKVHLLSINGRGSLALPRGSGAVMLRIAEGRYRDGLAHASHQESSSLPIENQIKVGRVSARVWSAN